MVIKMSEKELLYIDDTLGHLDYLVKHLTLNKECLTEEKQIDVVNKILKKNEKMYNEFYNLLKGE